MNTFFWSTYKVVVEFSREKKRTGSKLDTLNWKLVHLNFKGINWMIESVSFEKNF